jgi:competence ComEA-like helix-hairpin-helix protein
LKNKRIEIAAAIVTAVFVSFTLGYFLGRRAAPSGVSVGSGVSAVSTPSATPEERAAPTLVNTPANTPANTPTSGEAEPTAEPVSADPTPESHRDAQGRLRINLATPEELEELPGVGPAIAARIYEYIQTNGPLKRTASLKNVSGIGDKKFDAMKDLITTD